MKSYSIQLPDGRDICGLSAINVLLGKNGCGKSRLLRAIAAYEESGASARYISPERAGRLSFDSGVTQNLFNNPNWMPNQRRRNFVQNFMEQAFARFGMLELQVLRRLEQAKERAAMPPFTFQPYIDSINELLDHVEVQREAGQYFSVCYRETREIANPEHLSSGEKQLIALAIDCLAFEVIDRDPTCAENILLIDEPDLHLHPDLQHRLAHFVVGITERSATRVIIATHSTPLLGALEGRDDVRVCFMDPGSPQISFESITDAHRAVLPVFGAHPLSAIFNRQPVLLVEGEDDERLWQTVVRSSNGRVVVHPVGCGGVPRLHEYECIANRIIQAVYEEGVGYSLRDRDDKTGELDDVGAIRRYRLGWRASENLLLTDEVLEFWGTSWEEVKSSLSHWIDGNPRHPSREAVREFVEAGCPRETADLKRLRNIIAGLVSETKAWEVLVGKAVADAIVKDRIGVSLRAGLGPKFIEEVLQRRAPAGSRRSK